MAGFIGFGPSIIPSSDLHFPLQQKMGSQSSKPQPAFIAPKAVPQLNEKSNIAPPSYSKTLKSDSTSDSPSIIPSTLDKWSTNFESNPTLLLSRLVLSNSDPIASLTRRSAYIDDEKVFNLELKGVGPKSLYPGPRTNQASSGRCWLFATSK